MATGLETVSDSRSYVDELVHMLHSYLKSDCGIMPTEIVKAGSLGQGTAIPGDYDLDLVVYSRDISPETLSCGIQDILEKIDRLLANYFSRKYQKKDITASAVRFSIENKLKVDLLPSPYWLNADEYHQHLKTLHKTRPSDIRLFSCSAAKWQKQFFLAQPPQVREYIKKAKAWRNIKWPEKQDGIGRPKSFLISLLVVEAYKRSNDRSPASVTSAMKQLVKNHDEMRLHWTHDGALYSRDYDSYFPRRSQPCIIDPANPFNNVYVSGISRYSANSSEGTYEQGDGNWTNFVRYIDTLSLTA